MNDREVYLVTTDDEVYLGTVGEFTGNTLFTLDNRGMSPDAVISDMVSELAFGDYLPDFIIKKNFSIELRVPGTT